MSNKKVLAPISVKDSNLIKNVEAEVVMEEESGHAVIKQLKKNTSAPPF